MWKLWVVFSLLGTLAFGFDHNHASWDAWLKKYVTVRGAVSTVDYKLAKVNLAELESYLKVLESVGAKEFLAFSEPQKLAFLINSYNAFTVKLILNHYPVKSIKKIGSLFSSPWKMKFFKLFGEDSYLDQIEHERIRKEFAEPRIHFAVVCASKGCPALRNEAFRADKLESQFESAAMNFLKDSERNLYGKEKNEFQLSKIFDWYGDDFKKNFGSVQAFVASRLAQNPEEEARMKSASLKFLDYDWSLNEATATPKS